MTITGGQAIGNGTAGAGGIDWTNLGAGGTKSVAHFNRADVPRVDSSGAPGCPISAAPTGTLIGDYNLTSATNITFTPGPVDPPLPTAIEPANTEFTMTSTNSKFTVDPEAFSVSCSTSVLTGDTGALTHTTWAAATITTLTYTGCTAPSGAATVTSTESCLTSGGRPSLLGMATNAATASGAITLPSSCSIGISIPSVGCSMTITGGQMIGNGTPGAGGVDWTNLSAFGEGSVAQFKNAHIPVIESTSTGLGCPALGPHTGTLTGDYAVTSATNITITP